MVRALFIGAHCDDIELGCGGTVAKCHEAGWRMHFVVLSCVPDRAPCMLRALGPYGSTEFCYVPTQEFAQRRQEIWQIFAHLQTRLCPETVFVHGPHDTHQDHAATYAEAIRKTFKGNILRYYPAMHNDRENYFEPLAHKHVQKKLQMLRRYTMLTEKPYFDQEYVKARMRCSGFAASSKYAEGFCVERLIAT